MDNTEIMPIHDFHSERLFVDAPLGAGKAVECTSQQAHYLLNVLRLKSRDTILVFNGRDGEWKATLRDTARRRCHMATRRERCAPSHGA